MRSARGLSAKECAPLLFFFAFTIFLIFPRFSGSNEIEHEVENEITQLFI